jgi:hypothetical protein
VPNTEVAPVPLTPIPTTTPLITGSAVDAAAYMR